MSEVYGTCTICSLPVLAGQARYTVTENHYDCEYPDGFVSPMDMLKQAEERLFGVTGRKVRAAPCKPGDGPVAKKVAILLSKLFKEDFGWEIDPASMSFWVQAPAYRGPKFDLAVWGCSFPHPDFKKLNVSVHSWDTMTRLLKRPKIKLMADGGWSFDVG
ncbi:hypothetical protein [Flavobacterium sp.]|uniref:hypothetical protein n=1 Tax=Flavobacterium sp. TaxID=239 RepID=UPI00261F1835|nr:hypothetical protein [Flavobacterium sp.]